MKTMKLGWLSDIHLNFLNSAGCSRFFDHLATHEVQGWLLSGDIGEADSIVGYLNEFSSRLSVPTYFVLGNHDFYFGPLAKVKTRVSAACSSDDQLVWLTEADPIRLGENLALVGDDSWADGRLGNPQETPVRLNDFRLIEELTGHSRADLVALLNRLGDESAGRLRTKLQRAAAMCANVLVVLHVPPFKGATWHEGEISSPDWLPWFSCEAVGQALEEVASANPDTNFTVLCGHTHSRGRFSPRSNISVHTAVAEYGFPGVQEVIDFGEDGAPRLG